MAQNLFILFQGQHCARQWNTCFESRSSYLGGVSKLCEYLKLIELVLGGIAGKQAHVRTRSRVLFVARFAYDSKFAT